MNHIELRMIREILLDMTREELADALNVELETLHDWEICSSNFRTFPVDALVKLVSERTERVSAPIDILRLVQAELESRYYEWLRTVSDQDLLDSTWASHALFFDISDQSFGVRRDNERYLEEIDPNLACIYSGMFPEIDDAPLHNFLNRWFDQVSDPCEAFEAAAEDDTARALICAYQHRALMQCADLLIEQIGTQYEELCVREAIEHDCVS